MDLRRGEWGGFANNIRCFEISSWLSTWAYGQFQDALKLHAAGRPIPRADLPDPPGFAPIPITDTPQVSKIIWLRQSTC